MSSPDLSSDILIGIIGKTGSGKSYFINATIGKDLAQAGDQADSMTSDVGQYDYTHKSGRAVRLLDTPGFDYRGNEGTKTDKEILDMISAFLKKRYGDSKKLSGIILLHSINDSKVNWKRQRNRSLLRKLREPNSTMDNVVVVTSFWDLCNTIKDGESRERELQTDEGLLAEYHDGHATFVRTGQFNDQWPAGPAFLTPQQIVDDLALKIIAPPRPNQEANLLKQIRNDLDALKVAEVNRQRQERQEGLDQDNWSKLATKENLEVISARVAGVQEYMNAQFATKQEIDALSINHASMYEGLTESIAEWKEQSLERFATKEELESLSTSNQEAFDRIQRVISTIREDVSASRRSDLDQIVQLKEQLERVQRDCDALHQECKGLRAESQSDLKHHLQRLEEELNSGKQLHQTHRATPESSSSPTRVGRYWGFRLCIVQ